MSHIFSSFCLILLILGSSVGCALLVRKKRFSLVCCCILALSLVIKTYFALDAHLHAWDERYHALVAKHLIDHPLVPTLYESPVEPYNYQQWTTNHVWLSKPPLPLWCIALSIKVFGLHEVAVRIPALIFATLSIFLTYLFARRLLGEKIAWIACALHAGHGMLTDLASGRLSSDGVETCFLFFVQLGMYFVFRKSRGFFEWKDYMLAGIATGLGIMCKWQPALLVLVVMFVYHFQYGNWKRHLIGSVFSLVSALAIFSPWCVYILQAFPTEASWTLKAIFTPFIDQSLNTDGTWYSYLTDFGNLFGYSAYIILALVAWKGIREKSALWLTLVLWAVLPLAIFSMAEVKRGTYLFISAPALFILIAYAASSTWKGASGSARLLPVVGYLSVFFVAGYSIEKLYLFKPKGSSYEWSHAIKNNYYPKGIVIYDEPHCIELMFYHDVTAYPFPQPR